MKEGKIIDALEIRKVEKDTELADKLLPYKNDRKTLIKKIISARPQGGKE